MAEMLLYAKMFFIFVIGVIIGRLTMAIQYALMKPVKKEIKEVKSTSTTLEAAAQKTH